MNNLDARYQTLLEDILQWGVEKTDRTGTGTISVFGRQIRHKMSEGFPLLTTKKMAWNVMVAELLWFLRGDTNIKFLLDYDCHIWDGDAYKNFANAVDKRWQQSAVGDLDDMIYDGSLIDGTDENGQWFARIPTKEEFIGRIKVDDEFAKKWGELGPIYGKQWRKWTQYEIDMPGFDVHFNETHTDQIQNLINDLKTNPDSRRLMVNAWNVGELDRMVLPPCHYGFQVYTRELELQERLNILEKRHPLYFMEQQLGGEDILTRNNIPTRTISLMWNQRSVDTFLGLPFNIASYGLLLEIIAKEVNMVPDELIGNLGDVHLYKNHIEQAKEQISRDWFELPTVKITERNWYMHEKVKEHLGEKTLDQKLKSYRPDCFELIGYQSHPKIKAPLSN